VSVGKSEVAGRDRSALVVGPVEDVDVLEVEVGGAWSDVRLAPPHVRRARVEPLVATLGQVFAERDRNAPASAADVEDGLVRLQPADPTEVLDPLLPLVQVLLAGADQVAGRLEVAACSHHETPAFRSAAESERLFAACICSQIDKGSPFTA